jgi:endonuclease YncB( thermonuclease family)
VVKTGASGLSEGEEKDGAPRMRPEPMPAWAGGRRKRQPYVRPRWSAALLVPVTAVVLLLVWVVSPPGLPAGPITGKSRVVDGDTLDVGNRRIRLAGIDAPERAQQCTDAAQQPSPCGETARRTLADFVGQGPVTCTPLEQDRYGRVVATCEFGGADLGGVLVGAGQAVDGGRYGGLEQEAKAAGRGIWVGTFEPPAQWRRAHKVDDAEGAPQSPITSLINWVRNVFFR